MPPIPATIQPPGSVAGHTFLGRAKEASTLAVNPVAGLCAKNQRRVEHNSAAQGRLWKFYQTGRRKEGARIRLAAYRTAEKARIAAAAHRHSRKWASGSALVSPDYRRQNARTSTSGWPSGISLGDRWERQCVAEPSYVGCSWSPSRPGSACMARATDVGQPRDCISSATTSGNILHTSVSFVATRHWRGQVRENGAQPGADLLWLEPG